MFLALNDSRWIKWFAMATAVLAISLVFLTIVLARYAFSLGHAKTVELTSHLSEAINLQVRRRNNPRLRLPQLRLYRGQYP